MDGIRLTSVGAILIQDAEESPAELELTYGTRLIRAGQDLIPIQIVIVQAHQNGLFAVDTQLCGQTVGRGGLTGRAWAGQHNGLCAPITDHIRDPGVILLVQSLIDPDQLSDAAGIHQIIQICNSLTIHKVAPFFSF